jgi:hypothetical protein
VPGLVVDAFICIVIVLGLGSFDPSLLLTASLVMLIIVALRASHCIARRQYRRWQSIKAQMRLSAQQNRQRCMLRVLYTPGALMMLDRKR